MKSAFSCVDSSRQPAQSHNIIILFLFYPGHVDTRDRPIRPLMKKSDKYLQFKENLDGFQNYRQAFTTYIDDFHSLQKEANIAVNSGTINCIEQWFPDINPISPHKTANFMAIHRYGFISRSFYQDGPSAAFFSNLENLPELIHIQKLSQREATYQEIHESVINTGHQKILSDLLDDLEKKAVSETKAFLEEIMEWGEFVLERLDTDHVNGSLLEDFQQSIKTVRIYSILLKLVTERKPARLLEEVRQSIFPILYSLTILCVDGTSSFREYQQSMAADSPKRAIFRTDLEDSWTLLDAFFHFYDSDHISKPEREITDFCSPGAEETSFKCLFIDKQVAGRSLVKECLIRVLYNVKPGKSAGGRIRFRCLSLDRDGRNLKGTDIASTIEQAVIGAHRKYRAKKRLNQYKHYFDKEARRLDTVFYSIGDTLEDYDGESIGASSYCAGLSLFSGYGIGEGIYFTGRIDNAGCNPNDVSHVRAKVELVKKQPLPEGRNRHVFVMPAANFRQDFKDYQPADDDGVEILTYGRNEKLFSIWFQHAGIEKKERLHTLPSEKMRIEYRRFLSASAFRERNNSEQGRLINGLLYLISVLAPYQEIDIRTFADGLERLEPEPQIPYIDNGILSRLMTDSDHELSDTVHYLEEREFISGDVNAFETNTDFQKYIREYLSDEEKRSIAVLYDKLLDSVIEADPQGTLIPHIHEWVKFNSQYKIEDTDPMGKLEKLTEYHLNQYQTTYGGSGDTVILADNKGKFRDITFLIEDFKSDLERNNAQPNKELSTELEKELQQVQYVTREIEATASILERRHPENYEHGELIKLHFKHLAAISRQEKFDSMTSFQLIFHAQKLAGLIDPQQPDPISAKLLKRFKEKHHLPDPADRTQLAKLLIRTFLEKWIAETYSDKVRHAKKYQNARHLIDKFMNS